MAALQVVWTEVKGKGEAEAAEVAGRCLVLAAENSKEWDMSGEHSVPGRGCRVWGYSTSET